VTILEATLAVYPARPKRALCVLGYRDVYEAGDHVPQIRAFRPVGLEGMDDRLLDDMRRTGLHAEDIGLLPMARAGCSSSSVRTRMTRPRHRRGR
jgi:hypothetical protein